MLKFNRAKHTAELFCYTSRFPLQSVAQNNSVKPNKTTVQLYNLHNVFCTIKTKQQQRILRNITALHVGVFIEIKRNSS